MTQREQIIKAESYIEKACILLDAAYFIVPEGTNVTESLFDSQSKLREIRADLRYARMYSKELDTEDPAASRNIAYALSLVDEVEEGGVA